MKSKRFLLLLVTFAAIVTGFSQTTPKVKEQVQYIRKAYQNAQKAANEAKTSEEIHLRNYSEFTHRVNHGGSGPSKEVFEFFFDTNEHIEEDYYESYEIYLIRRSWNIAAYNFYEEFLFDRETYRPLFYYYKGFDIDDGNITEVRWYFKDWELIYEMTKKTDLQGKTVRDEARECNGDNGDALLTLRRGQSYVEGFNNFVNINFE